LDDVTYLWVAEAVLRKHKRPLKARELVNYGLEDGLFPAVGLSQTPQKSMQARLSLDILNNPQSPFVRTSRGRFFLKDFLPASPSDGPSLTVYTAERRIPSPATEMVLCVPRQHYSRHIDFQGIGRVGLNDPLSFISFDNSVYLPRTVAETSSEFKQIITYTVIQHQSKVLSFRRGLYNRAASFLRGAQCVGFGGHVTNEDFDLFSANDLGIRQNAAREIHEELMLTSGRPRISASDFEYLGTLNDDSSDVGVRHLAVVLRYWVSDWSEWKNVSKGEVSINRLRWIDTASESINLSEFEYWSQLVMRRFYPNSMSMMPSFKVQRAAPFGLPHILCVVGSIGSGKSATSKFLAKRCNYTTVNSGRVLAPLIDLPPIPDTSRHVFQAAAEAFITEPDGPTRLGTALAEAANAADADRVLIDGIRHPETLDVLRQKASKEVALLYVYTPPDVAFEMYKERENYGEGSTTFQEFVDLYSAPVESKIRYMLGDADIVIFNWLGLSAYTEALARLSKVLNDAR
jgi:predicted NUDIX family phosphoesterase